MHEKTAGSSRDTGVHPLLPQAIALHQAGRLPEASQIYESILKDEPLNFDATHMLGVIAMQEGRLEEAKLAISAALVSRPDDRAALSNLTVVHLRLSEFENAAQVGERASRLIPASVDALINYGTALHHLERYRDALTPLEIAQFLNPRSLEVCHILGSCHMKLGDYQRAAVLFEIATAVAPTDASSWTKLAAVRSALSQHEAALECAAKAAALSQDSSNSLAAQATALFELGKIEESVSLYEKAVAANPTVSMLCGLSRALITSGRHDDAIPHLQRAVELDPLDPYAQVMLATSVLKPVYMSVAEIEQSRIAFEESITRLNAWYAATKPRHAHLAVGAMQPFFLAYHPYNNKDLLSRFGDVSSEWMKTLPNAVAQPSSTKRTGKYRIGIVSAHVRDQSVWNAILKGWVHQLDRNKFDIHLFKLDGLRDRETSLAKAQVAQFDDAPKTTQGWANAIRSANLDALIFDEVGMDFLTLQLAALRLAPLQAATWGHPESSGLPTIDFYLSGDALEPPDAQANYREQIVRLPNLGVYVEPLEPMVKDPDFRFLRLPKDEPLLICAGSPFKYSPIRDWVWVEIARGLKAAGSGRLVFFSDVKGTMHLHLADRLRAAFSQAGLVFDDYVCTVAFLDRPSFFGLLRESALMLDTLDFSGFNTALQSIECGLPYLAFEGKFMRGRLGSCLVRRMDLPELIATSYEQFVQMAVQLATDKRRLSEVRKKIATRRDLLFRDLSTIRALEVFLSQQIDISRARGV